MCFFLNIYKIHVLKRSTTTTPIRGDIRNGLVLQNICHLNQRSGHENSWPLPTYVFVLTNSIFHLKLNIFMSSSLTNYALARGQKLPICGTHKQVFIASTIC